ncbi:hypothetical protein [Bradyrhizobium sp. Arg816]|uniref:hypothetical protein n=1 Tax=Bradyrhizobium sp. Arg816 TaxID=2998491 RepID=UPI00249EC42D|nr:hypothetical protein [Bradyrhizobium sp. Arg816]MDI3561743.1 hypothetical protein [Bradyrhizobium sp. Arg816]
MNVRPFFATAMILVATLQTSSVSGQSGVKIFRNSYIEFEMPAAWDCEQDGVAFACQEANRKSVDMMALLAAKVVDPQRDTLEVYASQLAQPKEWKDLSGGITVSSEVRSGTKCYDGKLWQWAHHYQSELHNYYTDYFVRIQGGITALVTMSYHRSVETEGSAIAATIARRLRMIASQLDQDATEC